MPSTTKDTKVHEVRTNALDHAPAMMLSMTPEDQLCLLLARGQVSPEVRSRSLQFLATPLQWAAVLERACAQQVYPLLYRNLRDLGFPGVPEAVQAELKGLYLANAFRNQLLAEELARLLRLLGESGIRVVPLKGVALAQSLYGDVAARVCADIDILVPPADVEQTIALLLASGYLAEPNHPYLSKLALRHGRHFSMVREGRGISFLLELHWILVQHSSQNDEAVRDLWAEGRPQAFFGAPAFSLSPEWEFLYLCIHAVDHEWRSLKWLIDIHEVASASEIDWPKIAQKAGQFEIGLPVEQTLAVSAMLLGTPLPSGYSPAALPEGVKLFPDNPPFEEAENSLAFRHLRLLRRPLDKMRYFSSILFAPKATDLEFLRLPPAFRFLYYLIRPVRLAGKWGWWILRGAFGKS
jgi:hypothetical protein